MAQTLVNVIEVKVTGNQAVTIYIAPLSTSTIFTKSGQIALQPKGTVTAEDNRFDIGQLESLRKNSRIQFQRSQRALSVTPSPTGSTGSA